VPICNFDGSNNLFGLNREHDITKNPLRFVNQPIADEWQLSQVRGRGDARRLHHARRLNDAHRRRDEQKRSEQKYHQRWRLRRGTIVERYDPGPSNTRPGRSANYLTHAYPANVLDVANESVDVVILGNLMQPPPTEYDEDVRLEWEVEGVVPSHPSTEHVEPRIVWKAPPSCFDFSYVSFTGVATSSYPSSEDAPWLYASLPSDDEAWYASDDEDENVQPPADPPGPEQPTIDQPTPSYAIDRNEDILEMSPDIEIDIADDEPIIELTMYF